MSAICDRKTSTSTSGAASMTYGFVLGCILPPKLYRFTSKMISSLLSRSQKHRGMPPDKLV
jgi:hypothetical protein